jgi:hypothetical protein
MLPVLTRSCYTAWQVNMAKLTNVNTTSGQGAVLDGLRISSISAVGFAKTIQSDDGGSSTACLSRQCAPLQCDSPPITCHYAAHSLRNSAIFCHMVPFRVNADFYYSTHRDVLNTNPAFLCEGCHGFARFIMFKKTPWSESTNELYRPKIMCNSLKTGTNLLLF